MILDGAGPICVAGPSAEVSVINAIVVVYLCLRSELGVAKRVYTDLNGKTAWQVYNIAWGYKL